LPALATDLVSRKIDVLFAGGGAAVGAAADATSSIPIVFVMGGDPIARGLTQHVIINRPNRNVTGAWFAADATAGKIVDLLHELVPAAGLIGILINPTNPFPGAMKNIEEAAAALGLKTMVLTASIADQLEAAIAAGQRQGIGGLIVIDNPFLNTSTLLPSCRLDIPFLRSTPR
jgi:putative ABC transport system substrate-binding protein